ncbi:coat F domain-containing protein [Melghiribacillus thermohalophilus]|uniref:Coat F domain-containing protein n=1 Tax=Melghiribacillus thermohalophilus TaxID=1324956 RepID=A0A4R3MTR7_9BACI|nr:spore coat protein [Melghiribacillus thermohalophilus]TCT19117.1 coat F domain-containing protein [Melghiribacillus thermohalophilus]
MPSQKVNNPETVVPDTSQMNDRDFLNDMLNTEKYLTGSYNIAMNEVSNQNMYQELSTIFKETQDVQRNLYNVMFQHGWYSLEVADQQTMQQSYQKYSGYTNQFPYVN